MSDPFLGEIRMFAGAYAPRFWAFCNGQVLAISDNNALYSLLGTAYGGDGTVGEVARGRYAGPSTGLLWSGARTLSLRHGPKEWCGAGDIEFNSNPQS